MGPLSVEGGAPARNPRRPENHLARQPYVPAKGGARPGEWQFEAPAADPGSGAPFREKAFRHGRRGEVDPGARQVGNERAALGPRRARDRTADPLLPRERRPLTPARDPAEGAEHDERRQQDGPGRAGALEDQPEAEGDEQHGPERSGLSPE